MNDIPEWALEEARVLLVEGVWRHSPLVAEEFVARALVKAKEQGIAEERERAATIAYAESIVHCTARGHWPDAHCIAQGVAASIREGA